MLALEPETFKNTCDRLQLFAKEFQLKIDRQELFKATCRTLKKVKPCCIIFYILFQGFNFSRLIVINLPSSEQVTLQYNTTTYHYCLQQVILEFLRAYAI